MNVREFFETMAESYQTVHVQEYSKDEKRNRVWDISPDSSALTSVPDEILDAKVKTAVFAGNSVKIIVETDMLPYYMVTDIVYDTADREKAEKLPKKLLIPSRFFEHDIDPNNYIERITGMRGTSFKLTAV